MFSISLFRISRDQCSPLVHIEFLSLLLDALKKLYLAFRSIVCWTISSLVSWTRAFCTHMWTTTAIVLALLEIPISAAPYAPCAQSFSRRWDRLTGRYFWIYIGCYIPAIAGFFVVWIVFVCVWKKWWRLPRRVFVHVSAVWIRGSKAISMLCWKRRSLFFFWFLFVFQLFGIVLDLFLFSRPLESPVFHLLACSLESSSTNFLWALRRISRFLIASLSWVEVASSKCWQWIRGGNILIVQLIHSLFNSDTTSDSKMT